MRRPLTALLLLATACTTLPGAKRPDPPRAVEGAHRGGTLTVAITAPGAIEPTNAYEPSGQLVSSVACETLVTLDPSTGDPHPGLAESWVLADGGANLIVKLRKGAYFHDGTEVRSLDVVNSLKRLADPDYGSYEADLLSDVLGYAEARERAETEPFRLDNIRIVEPYSFEIRLADKLPDFIRVLAHPATAPIQMKAALANQSAFARAPVCAGPYAYAKPYRPGDPEIVLERFARYHGGNARFTSGGDGYADRIVFKVFPDADAASQAYASGQADLAPVPPSRLAETKQSTELTSGGTPLVELIGLPRGAASQFNDADVRRTLAAALDRAQIARDVFGGSRTPANGFLPPALGDVARDAACAFEAPSTPKLPDGPVKLYYNDEYAHRAMAESVAAQWRTKLGIAVETLPLNWDEYLQKATTGAGFDGAFRMSWIPGYASGVAVLGPLFHSRFIGSSNLMRANDPRFDQAFEKDVLPAFEEDDRKLQLQKVEDRLCREVPAIPVAFGGSHWLVRPALASARRDGRVLAFDGTPLLREVFVR